MLDWVFSRYSLSTYTASSLCILTLRPKGAFSSHAIFSVFSNFCLLKCASFGCPKRHRRQRGPRECVLAPSLAVRCFAARARGLAASVGAPTPSTAFVSTKSRREVANKCTPVALLPGHHRAKLRASSCAIVTVLASREADPTVSAFRGWG